MVLKENTVRKFLKKRPKNDVGSAHGSEFRYCTCNFRVQRVKTPTETKKKYVGLREISDIVKIMGVQVA
jgi:hypothetical protein